MGTRADFYVGTGKSAEWIGSIAWDGHDDTLKDDPASARIFHARTDSGFREAVAQFLASREDATAPEQGWPWPWDDSRTTDYAYCFDGEVTRIFNFGSPVVAGDTDEAAEARPEAEFPDMSARKNVAWDKRSGLLIIGGGPL